ncbi:hypothetical protein [Algisphaera agarilytica]|uniref:Lipoprotein n=1 Tax=Algisphaera agarilytica TaxID=1385975 RepID=A0A7X0H483_9BACT|nr:hypothetical protein [Algisphaera agarilytica]MBB6428914.1 hypothetical protein [Algisphaera agarilytica]
MKPSSSILLGVACATTFAAGCSSTVATVEGPEHRQKLGIPHPVAVNLDDKRADPATFAASINGSDITQAFVFNDDEVTLSDEFVYEPTTGRTPHQLTVTAEPALNAKGRPMGKSFEQTLTFFPPSLSLQGNVGMGANSRINVPQDGRTSVMVKLPQAPHRETTLTIRPVATDAQVVGDISADDMINCIALNDSEPGEAITLTIMPGQRVAVFTVRGHTTGVNELRAEAPGYVATAIDVYIDSPAVTAAVNTY